jgi:hypothetical protein
MTARSDGKGRNVVAVQRPRLRNQVKAVGKARSGNRSDGGRHIDIPYAIVDEFTDEQIPLWTNR